MSVLIQPLDFGAPLTVRQRLLPHWLQDGCAYFVTCHLGDSLPTPILRLWDSVRQNWLARHPLPWSGPEAAEYHERFTEEMERHLDAGRGSCALQQRACAQALLDTLAKGDGARYDLGTYAVMPNHLHLLVVPRPGVELMRLTENWQRVSALRINRRLGGRGSLWGRDSYDHIVRNAKELSRIDAYIRGNPRKAGLPEGSVLAGGSIDGWTVLPRRGPVPASPDPW